MREDLGENLLWDKADPIGDKAQKTAEMKIQPRRPKKLFKGSEHQHPLQGCVS